jgi:uncharacterized protein YbgA (DUF1722 family)
MSEKIRACLLLDPVWPVAVKERLLCGNIVERFYALHELNSLYDDGLTRGKLIAFHSRYKLLLLAHSQPDYRELGPFVATLHEWASLEAWFREYRQRLMKLMSHPATRRNHTNVLMHVQGYFRSPLNSPQRQALSAVINDYRQAVQPLLAPVSLLKHYMAEFPNTYLSSQRYFDSRPETLRLRYGS